MTTYRIIEGKSHMVVRARSSIHDSETVWKKVTGTVHADSANLAQSGATASFTVDMRDFDAGDWLKNRKLKKDLDADSHPHATFELTGLEEVQQASDGSFEARALGTLSWRGRSVDVVAKGTGTLDDSHVEVKATFELDVTKLGVKPPRVLMFKVEDVVEVTVTLHGIVS